MIDYYRRLPRAKGGVKHILVTVDFSKFVKLFLMEKMNTRAVLRAITWFYFPRFKKHEKILFDQDKQIAHKLWKEMLEGIEIEPILMSIWHPQINLAIRLNRELGQYFWIRCNPNNTIRVEQLAFTEDCTNNGHQTKQLVTRKPNCS